jgi:hypothetical protein
MKKFLSNAVKVAAPVVCFAVSLSGAGLLVAVVAGGVTLYVGDVMGD